VTSLSVEVEERVGERTVETVVLLRRLGMVPVVLATGALVIMVVVAAGVVAAEVEAGKREGRMLRTSVGKAAYHSGVVPAEREDESWEMRAAGLERASS